MIADELLKGKKILIMGVANQRSIAWAIAKTFSLAGAELAFSYQDTRFKDKVKKLVDNEMPGALMLPCNVANDDNIKDMAAALKDKWGSLDGIVHSLAYAKKEELDGMFVHTSREGFLMAHEISAFSLAAVSNQLYPIMNEGGSILTLTFQGSERVVPNYNVMGVAKASLEASVRYLAADLGPLGIRVNAVSAGPIRTLSAKGVKDFNRLLDGVEEKTPLRRLADADDVAGTALFLISDLSRAVTGIVVHTDCGYHIMGV